MNYASVKRVSVHAFNTAAAQPPGTQRARTKALVGVSIFAVAASCLTGTAAWAQTQAPSVEEIVVTGSRVVRDGYEAPTPVSVIGVEALQTGATSNYADLINELPSVVGSSTPQTSAINTTSGQSAINGLSLRGLGTTRTLTLLNGQRTVGSILTGVVDVSELPQALVSRVDVVTGGASASYGSDALTGVVNFILDTDFTGVKGEVSGGITTYGDAPNYKVNLAAGAPFAGGRGHVLFSAEHAWDDGKLIIDRPWNQLGYFYIRNPDYTPTNGQPNLLARYNVALSTSSWGGTIASGPLRGVTFGPGGVQSMTAFGDIVVHPYMSGGSWRANQISPVRGNALQPRQNRQDVFTRVSYDITDAVQVYGHAAWGHLYSYSSGAPNFNLANLAIRTDNAFIPANLAPTLQAAGTTVTIGTFAWDLDNFHSVNDRRVTRFLAGAKGAFDAMQTEWTWDAYVGTGTASGSLKSIGARDQRRFALAIDAVRDPSTGSIVCRSTLGAPNNGCVPYNVFGIGVNSQAAVDYLQSRYGWAVNRLTQSVGAISFNGEPFSTWAGPVSIATGIEHRQEKMRQITDPEEQADPTIWFQAAGQPYSGKFSVSDAFLETVVPLAKDAPWARSLDFNGAVRATNYSTFGGVVTWKAGATWQVNDSIRLRGTQSRNIREPTLVDLYLGGTTSQGFFADPANNNAQITSRNTTRGNPNLQPEKSNETDLGIVYQPEFIPGFSVSFDYYRIAIADAVNTPGLGDLVTLCTAGNQDACSAFTRSGSGTTALIVGNLGPQNFATERQKGFDIEASYVLPLASVVDTWDGRLSARFLATHYISYLISSGLPGDVPVENAGVNARNGLPDWRYELSLAYSLEPINLGLKFRGLSSGIISATAIECTSGCPASTARRTTVDNNRIDGAFYIDLNMSYRLDIGETGTTDLFFNVRNLANKDPALLAISPAPASFPANQGLYDVMGRVFRAGLRFKM